MKYEAHPLAELIPPMSDDEYAELREDMKLNGQREPITLYEGKILDGRHRAKVCAELGREPLSREYDDSEPAGYVLSLNVKRRSLTTSQRAAIAVEFLPRLQEEARRRQATTQLGGRKPGGEPIGPAPRSHTDSTHRAREEAGELVGVSGASVDRARRVKEQAPEDFERVKHGQTTVREADRKLAGEESRPKGRPRAPTTDTERGRQVALANKRRLSQVLSAIHGYCDGLENFPLERAFALATEEDIAGWDSALADVIKKLRRVRSDIKENR